jgi:GDP-L-fucose synthase
MERNAKIYIAGHNGLVGSALERSLRADGYNKIITRTKSELDLRDQTKVEGFFKGEKPQYVFMAAAKVGGIQANINYPADFIYDNLQMQANVLHFSWKYGVEKLLFLGSSCIYPRECPQPIKEESFLTGPFEPTNQAYAVAKTAGIEMCQAYNQQHGTNFISAMPSNLFGPGDNFDPVNSHLMAALIRRCHEAKTQRKEQVVLWGTGTPKRELLYVDECARACLFLMDNYNSGDVVNVGTGVDLEIREIAEEVRKVVGFRGDLTYDATKPDGVMRKLLDVSKINSLGWKAKNDLPEEIGITYNWFLEKK